MSPLFDIDVRDTLHKCLELLYDAVVRHWLVRGSSGRVLILITVGDDGPPTCATAITLAADQTPSILSAMSTRNVLGSLWVEGQRPETATIVAEIMNELSFHSWMSRGICRT